MRIVLDMQGAQTESRFRGIGRYTMAFAQAVVRNKGEHEFFLALSGFFPHTIEPIREAFYGILPQENIRVWYAPGPVKDEDLNNTTRREVAELIREAFLTSLYPDIIHVTSLFEGYGDDAVTSIGRLDEFIPVSVTLYDLIPLINSCQYLKPNDNYADNYYKKIEFLKKSKVLLAISEFAQQEGVDHLGNHVSQIINVSTAIDSEFKPLLVDDQSRALLYNKFGIILPFVLYAGGCDERKNLPRLIEAWSKLPVLVREGHQLLFAGKIPDSTLTELRSIAEKFGLRNEELLFSGYVSDEELVLLNNLCKLFVFPSWHEGFGLPVLEAMACGAPVIGANRTSLPEVIGLDDALFDPFDVTSIRDKLARALTDEIYLANLRSHGLEQSKRFSWDNTALIAIAAWERQVAEHTRVNNVSPTVQSSHQKLFEAIAPQLGDANEQALISLATNIAKNECAGIERQLLLDISELHQRDSATGVQRVVRSYLHHLLRNPPCGFRVLPVYATLTDGYRYASTFTARFLGNPQPDMADAPIRWQRGDIFFGLDMQHHVQLAHRSTFARLRQDGVVTKFLVYDLLPIQLDDLFKDNNAKSLHEQWLSMIAAQDEAICISKATADAYEAWIQNNKVATATTFRTDWVHMGADLNGSQPSRGLPADASETLRVLESRPSFLTVSTLEPRKAQSQILDAVEALWSADEDVNLVFVGQQGWKIDDLVNRIDNHPENGKRLFWLKGISDEYLDRVYQNSTCLIAASMNEGFGLPLIEAARHSVPVIARDIPVFREVAEENVFYFSGESGEQLASAMSQWLRCYRDGTAPQSTGMRWLTWEQSTEQLKVGLIDTHYPRRQLLVDISELVRRDALTGIQRVVRNVLQELLAKPPAGYKIEPVYADLTQDYRYARAYTARLLGAPEPAIEDDLVEYTAGDAFLGLDFQPQIVAARVDTLRDMRRRGVQVSFVVYDLIPVRLPECFVPGTTEGFFRWLDVVTEVADTAVCISRTVACQLDEWVREYGLVRTRRMAIKWFYLGADPLPSIPIATQPRVFTDPADVPVFLMVGTVEPRKGHAVVLDAFELLWSHGIAARLVIAGKQGWLVDKLAQRIETHPAAGNTLHWYRQVDDAELEALYASASCLIAASYEEGFGLPLIEAALREVPVIARDLPVFREVAEDGAHYFPAADDGSLYDHLIKWIKLRERGEIPDPRQIRVNTWAESTDSLKAQLSLKEIY